LITPRPGAIAQKPGSATLPFFGEQPQLVDADGKGLEGATSGNLCITDSWPGQMRTVYGDHERFVQTYFSTYKGKYVTGEGFSSAINVLGYLPYLVLIPILAFFFLKDADSFRRSALMMLPQGRIRWRGDELFQDINSTLAAYIRAQLTACLIIGVICTAGFAIIGVRYALVLGVVAGMLEFIPLLGPVVVAVLAGTVAGFDGGTRALVVLIFLGVLRIVQDYVLYPRIIGSGIHLHPLAVILAILAGHELAGVAGIFLAIPVIAVLTVTYRHWLEHRGSSGLVAELLKPAEEPAVETPSAVEGALTPAPQGTTSATQATPAAAQPAAAPPPEPSAG
jgi:predicted PurR-regulated permease PerM